MTMKLFVLLILAVFASDKKENAESDPGNEKKIRDNEENPIVVKIEEDEYAKKKLKFIGVSYHKSNSKWRAQRWSKYENRQFYNGFYDNEETAAHASDTLARKLMKNGKQNLKLNFPGEYTEIYREEKTAISKFIGVSYNKKESKWYARRWRKVENKLIHNGCYDDEETAAHASDTLARKLMKNDEQKLKLNFPDYRSEVYRERVKSSKYIGVSYNEKKSKWFVQRHNKNEKKVYNGCYDDEETAAHASDTLARKLMENGQQKLKLNFPDDLTEVYRQEKKSKYIGVSYHKNNSKWRAQRWSKYENRQPQNGYYDNEETAAHASDTLARDLMKNGERDHKLNFPDDQTEVYPEENQKKKRKRPKELNLGHPQIN